MTDNTINDDKTSDGGGENMILAERYKIICKLVQVGECMEIV